MNVRAIYFLLITLFVGCLKNGSDDDEFLVLSKFNIYGVGYGTWFCKEDLQDTIFLNAKETMKLSKIVSIPLKATRHGVIVDSANSELMKMHSSFYIRFYQNNSEYQELKVDLNFGDSISYEDSLDTQHKEFLLIKDFPAFIYRPFVGDRSEGPVPKGSKSSTVNDSTSIQLVFINQTQKNLKEVEFKIIQKNNNYCSN